MAPQRCEGGQPRCGAPADAGRPGQPSSKPANLQDFRRNEPLDISYPDTDSPGDLVEIHSDNGTDQAMVWRTPPARRSETLPAVTSPSGPVGHVVGKATMPSDGPVAPGVGNRADTSRALWRRSQRAQGKRGFMTVDPRIQVPLPNLARQFVLPGYFLPSGPVGRQRPVAPGRTGATALQREGKAGEADWNGEQPAARGTSR